MTEREKMQNRKLYDANDRALCADRVRAKELCHAYNQLWPSDEAGKREILRRLLAKTGEDFCVTAPFWCDYGYNIRLGEHFYANHCHSGLCRGDIRRSCICGAELRVLYGRSSDRCHAPRAGTGVCLSHHRRRSCVDRRRRAGHARRHDREQCRDRGRKRRRPGHPERFGCRRQSLQGHSPNYGGRQTDLLGQIAPGCAAREKQDAKSKFGGQAK